MTETMEAAIDRAKREFVKDEAYKEFEEKFKPKLTTDDCFTPPAVYEAVKDWAVKEYGWEGREIVRPFYPGGDYERYEYPEGCVVIDNPPFSIASKIVGFYAERGIDYFLFAQENTLFSNRKAVSRIFTGQDIVFENGAKILIGFLASQGATIRSAPELGKRIAEANKEQKKGKELQKYEYGDNVITFGKMTYLAKNGIAIELDGAFIRRLDCQKENGKSIYGAGYLISDENAAKAAAAKAAVKTDGFVCTLSRREREIVETLNRKEKEARHGQMDGCGAGDPRHDG